MNSFHFRANTLESRFLEPSIFLRKPNQRLTIPNAALTSTRIFNWSPCHFNIVTGNPAFPLIFAPFPISLPRQKKLTRTVVLRTVVSKAWTKAFTFNSTFCNNAICGFFRLTAFCDDFKPCLSIHSPCFALLQTVVSKAWTKTFLLIPHFAIMQSVVFSG